MTRPLYLKSKESYGLQSEVQLFAIRLYYLRSLCGVNICFVGILYLKYTFFEIWAALYLSLLPLKRKLFFSFGLNWVTFFFWAKRIWIIITVVQLVYWHIFGISQKIFLYYRSQWTWGKPSNLRGPKHRICPCFDSH